MEHSTSEFWSFVFVSNFVLSISYLQDIDSANSPEITSSYKIASRFYTTSRKRDLKKEIPIQSSYLFEWFSPDLLKRKGGLSPSECGFEQALLALYT